MPPRCTWDLYPVAASFNFPRSMIQEVVSVCYVAIMCHKLGFNAVGNSCDIVFVNGEIKWKGI